MLKMQTGQSEVTDVVITSKTGFALSEAFLNLYHFLNFVLMLLFLDCFIGVQSFKYN